MSTGVDCRTASATPGLLKIYKLIKYPNDFNAPEFKTHFFF